MKGKDKVLSVRLENDVYEKFKEFCQERDLPASLLARHIIKDWIKQQESAKKFLEGTIEEIKQKLGEIEKEEGYEH